MGLIPVAAAEPLQALRRPGRGALVFPRLMGLRGKAVLALPTDADEDVAEAADECEDDSGKHG